MCDMFGQSHATVWVWCGGWRTGVLGVLGMEVKPSGLEASVFTC